MADSQIIEDNFIRKLTNIVEKNLSDDQFGVSELAHEIGMSRSNLLRKIQKSTSLSVSQFIRQVRLKRAMVIFKETDSTVSEVSYQVGFSSTSYFIKCFREFYGYSPGQVGNQEDTASSADDTQTPSSSRTILYGALLAILTIVAVVLFYPRIFNSDVADTSRPQLEKSIAVLPFINDSNDSTNVYFINGLMESVLGDLQQIEDLRVISRTSVEKYRNTNKSIPEIAKELNVSYFVEGSGQKLGDKIMLNVQLIEASTDNHLWAKQYDRKLEDIFDIQKEVARSITDEIEVIITPEEEERIERVPTNNMLAYDFFLKGLEHFYTYDDEEVWKAISLFEKAIEQDPEFARAYAFIGMSYYILDLFVVDKAHNDQVNHFADQALLLDPKSGQGLLAKAMFYMHEGQNEEAVPYLEKALEYNPNNVAIINMLSDFYTNRIPDTKKYLQYALKGVQLDIASKDSISTSYVYLHLSNALVQSGFIDEAEIYINKSLSYFPQNLFSEYLRAYVMFAKNRDFQKTKELLIAALQKDTNRLDIMQEVGKMCFYMRDYEEAYKYYKPYTDIKKRDKLGIFPGEDLKIAITLAEIGMEEDAQPYFENFKKYADEDNSVYKHLSLAAHYAYHGDTEKALENFKLFTQEDSYHYWTIAFLKSDQVFEDLKDLPEFNAAFRELEEKFWKSHAETEELLKEEGLI